MLQQNQKIFFEFCSRVGREKTILVCRFTSLLQRGMDARLLIDTHTESGVNQSGVQMCKNTRASSVKKEFRRERASVWISLVLEQYRVFGPEAPLSFDLLARLVSLARWRAEK